MQISDSSPILPSINNTVVSHCLEPQTLHTTFPVLVPFFTLRLALKGLVDHNHLGIEGGETVFGCFVLSSTNQSSI